MEEIQNLYDVACAVNQKEFVEKMTALVKTINTQEFTNVAVTGLRNSGKTTFINEAIGSEVWEPGAMDEDEKPLRISFEPVSEDEKFNCVLLANRPWHDLKAIIFELREETLINGNDLSKDMYPLDMVFFIISATAPFRSEEVNFLKALSLIKCQVVVNNISLVREAEREKVINYIATVNNSLGLPPVIFLESGQQFGKLVRSLVPTYMELQELHEQKCAVLFKRTLDTLEQAARKELIAQEEVDLKAEKTFSIETDELKSSCYTLRMDVEDYKRAAVERVTGRLSSYRESIVNEIIAQSKQTRDKDKLQSAAEEKYKSLSDSAIETLQKIFLDDLRRTDSSAKLLGVPQWTSDTITRLERFSPQNLLKELAQEKLNMSSAGESETNTSLLVGSGLVAGGLVLAPLPPLVSIGGVVAALGYGVVSYMKGKKRENHAAINALNETIRQALENIKDLVRKIADISYGKIIEQISLGEKTLATSKPTKNESRLAQLNNALQTIDQMKKIKEGSL